MRYATTLTIAAVSIVCLPAVASGEEVECFTLAGGTYCEPPGTERHALLAASQAEHLAAVPHLFPDGAASITPDARPLRQVAIVVDVPAVPSAPATRTVHRVAIDAPERHTAVLAGPSHHQPGHQLAI